MKQISDERVRKYIAPARIVFADGVEGAEILLKPSCGQATLWGASGALLKPGASIIIDYGRELHGGVKIVSGYVEAHKVAKLRLRFGESVSEAMGAPNNDHAMHDSIIDIAPMGATEFGSTGFRFVRLDFLDGDFTLEIKSLPAVSLMRELEYRGSFECSDKRLNEIWLTGAYTTHLCMQDYVWDGIKRDRLVWMGDMHPEAMVAATVFGRVETIEKSMDFVRAETPLPKHINGIGAYSLWWLITQRDWYRFHGAFDYLETQREYLKGLLKMIMGWIDDDGSEQMPGRRFLDWPSNADKDALHGGLQALMVIAIDAGAELCAALGENDLAKECRARASNMRGCLPKQVDSKQVNALLALSGMREPLEVNRMVLSNNPCHGISTFYGYYVLQARAMAGDFQGCLDVIRRYWGGMLDLGATSFWEHFDLDWLDGTGRIDEIPKAGARDIHKDCGAYCFTGLRHSFCHGWASGPTAWLSEHVLGVKLLKPGAQAIAIVPHLADLQWVCGRFPTPYGEIEVECKRLKSGELNTNFKAPEQVEVRKGF